MTQTPACITSGKAQFERVEVREAPGRRVRTTNWVAANLWSTDQRGGRPVCLLWEPDGEGEQLLEVEIPRHAAAIRRQRAGGIAAGLGHPGFPEGETEASGWTVRIAAAPSEPSEPLELLGSQETRAIPQGLEEGRNLLRADREPVSVTRREAQPRSRERHEDAYIAAIITRLGITPIVDQSGVDAARAAQDRAGSGGEPALIYGISGGVLAGLETRRLGWWSGTGIATPDGAGLFDATQVEIDAD